MKSRFVALTPRELLGEFAEIIGKINDHAFAAGMKLESKLIEDANGETTKKTLTLKRDDSLPNANITQMVMRQSRDIVITIEAPEFNETSGPDTLRDAGQVTYTALRLMEEVALFMHNVMLSMLEGTCKDDPTMVDRIEAEDKELGAVIRAALKKEEEMASQSPIEELLSMIKDLNDVDSGLRQNPRRGGLNTVYGILSKKLN